MTAAAPEFHPVDALENTFEEVHYMDFYRDLFPAGSFEKKGQMELGKYNGILVVVGEGDQRTKRYTVTDDLDVIADVAESADFCLMSPISYAGKSRKSENARFLYALTIDLDGIDSLKRFQFLMIQINDGANMKAFVWGLPRPTYIISSGTGVHLYYVFDRPVPLFSNIVKQLEKLKSRLTWQAWTQGASSLHDRVQYESLFQGFRVVGTITKRGDKCRAFRAGEKCSIEYLNDFVPAEYQATEFTYKSDLLLKDAAKKYPEWYRMRIVEKKPRGSWTCKKALYDWWIWQINAGAVQGNRYWCIMTLATYAMKCGVSFANLRRDAYSLLPLLNSRGDAFTTSDVDHALQAYSASYVNYPIHTIIARTGIQIPRNRRNGRKQAQHLKIMNAIRDIEYPDGEWRNKEGRPDKKRLVEEWRERHPEGRKADCVRDTGLSKPTVYKWWNTEKVER